MRRDILLIDDDVDTADLVRLALQVRVDWRLTWISRPSRALARLNTAPPDLALLDLHFPEVDGRDMLRAIRSHPAGTRVPVIVLSADSEDDRVPDCLNDGADDFISKPWKPEELVARINAVLRRGIPVGFPGKTLQYGTVRLDDASRRLTVADQQVELTPTEFTLMGLLMRQSGRIVDRRRLLKAIWGIRLGRHEKIHTRTLDAHIQNIRKRLRLPIDLFPSVRGIGYRFDVEAAESIPASLGNQSRRSKDVS